MRLLLPMLALPALAACTVGPDYHRPEVSLGQAYHEDAQIAPAEARWWRRFNDPVLDALVERALTQNLDIAAASARISQARASVEGAGAAMVPTLDAAGSAERDRTSLQTPFGAAASTLGFPRDYSLYQAGAQASWEIDLFGSLRRGREAARADLAASEANADWIRLGIVAETADAYLQLRGLQARLAVATQQLETEHKLVDLVRQRAAQGIVADRALNRTLGEERGLAAALPPLRAAIRAQANRLAVLTGQPAGSDLDGIATAAPIPLAPDPSGSSVPADLMRRRPDIVAAERQVAAASARIGVAVSDYYPHLSLGGLLGFASVGGASLLSGGAVQASATAGLRWRLFDFGKVDAEVAGARGKQAEALADYRGAVLRASEDVENALTGLVEGRRQIALRDEQVAALTRSRDQARAAYAQGAVSLIDVLDADHALLTVSDQLASARAETARASVQAIRALGGGWSNGV